MGWSSWSFVRHNPSAPTIEGQADALKNSGLAAVGYSYVNVDDFWYQCPGSQGPNVDANGRWVTDNTKFPNSGSTNGIQVVANDVHAAGLKFGLYVTPGVSMQAVNQRSAILGTSNTVDQIVTTTAGKNYNCKGMVGIDYTKPGAQQFINSWANEFAAWGVDRVKIDGVGTGDIPDIQAWSAALQQTGRPIHLELSKQPRDQGCLDLAAVLQRLAYRRRHRVLQLRVGRQQLPADRLVARAEPVFSRPFGLADWLTVPAATRAKRVGIWHGLGNVVMVALFFVSWLVRTGSADHAVTTPMFVVEVVAIALGSVTAWLGGELVDRLGIGPDTDANPDAPGSLPLRPAGRGTQGRAAHA
jgi:hypothetical protein